MDESHSAPPMAGSGGQAQPNAGVASLAHWSVAIGNFIVPFAHLIIPIVLLYTTGKDDKFVADNAKEALNLLITEILLAIVFGILVLLLIGFVLLGLLWLYTMVFSIIAAVQTMSATTDSPVYRYPLVLRLIK